MMNYRDYQLNGTNQTVNCTLAIDYGNKPGDVLAYSTGVAPPYSSGGSVVRFNMPSGITLNARTNYWVCLSTPENGLNVWGISEPSGNGYGSAYPIPVQFTASVNGGATWGTAERVAPGMFAIRVAGDPVTPPPPPPPKTYAILVGSHAPSDGNPDGVRGDLDVGNVAAKLTWASDVKTIVYNNWSAPDTVAVDIHNAVLAIAAKAQSGDSLIFYYAGHGSGGSGPGVEDFINGLQGSSYQDDTLTSLLADSRLADVKKFVLLDSCHSEGFWKNDSAIDNDLQTLSNISFLSAATEDGVSWSDPSKNNTGFFTNAILSGIKPDATFASLLALAKGAYPDTVTGYFRDDGYGTGKWEVASSILSQIF